MGFYEDALLENLRDICSSNISSHKLFLFKRIILKLPIKNEIIERLFSVIENTKCEILEPLVEIIQIFIDISRKDFLKLFKLPPNKSEIDIIKCTPNILSNLSEILLNNKLEEEKQQFWINLLSKLSIISQIMILYISLYKLYYIRSLNDHKKTNMIIKYPNLILFIRNLPVSIQIKNLTFYYLINLFLQLIKSWENTEINKTEDIIYLSKIKTLLSLIKEKKQKDIIKFNSIIPKNTAKFNKIIINYFEKDKKLLSFGSRLNLYEIYEKLIQFIIENDKVNSIEDDFEYILENLLIIFQNKNKILLDNQLVISLHFTSLRKLQNENEILLFSIVYLTIDISKNLRNKCESYKNNNLRNIKQNWIYIIQLIKFLNEIYSFSILLMDEKENLIKNLFNEMEENFKQFPLLWFDILNEIDSSSKNDCLDSFSLWFYVEHFYNRVFINDNWNFLFMRFIYNENNHDSISNFYQLLINKYSTRDILYFFIQIIFCLFPAIQNGFSFILSEVN